MKLISQLAERDIKILKAIYEVGKATSEELAKKLGEPYTVSDLTAYLNRLEMENLLEKVQEEPLTYKLSGLGLIAIGALPEKARRVFCWYLQTNPSFFTLE